MRSFHTIKINFCGGIISPGDLYNILVAAARAEVLYVKFGLRQQLLIDVSGYAMELLTGELSKLGIPYECDTDNYPNIVSSYPAEEVFITNTWLSEGVYKDIFDLIDYQPKLKINVSDSSQSFTPLFTGNINWVASPGCPHFWHLFIRFPKTNTIYEWKDMVYTNDLPRMSGKIEALILEYPGAFNGPASDAGDTLYKIIKEDSYITKPVEAALELPSFNLPYYEGLNRYNDKYWLGIYRRDEQFSIEFLKQVCLLCLETRIGQLCTSPWKSVIIKGIAEKDKIHWSYLLAKHQVNMRHAANELNFQVEDNCRQGLELKKYLVRHLNNNDTRSFGICIGIKTRKKSEVFSSILVRRRPLIRFGKIELLHVYDILCARNFNPNERTGFAYSRGNPKFLLPEQLRRAILSFYSYQSRQLTPAMNAYKKDAPGNKGKKEYVNQCPHCFTVYDPGTGEPENNIVAGTGFAELPATYSCPVCEAPKNEFITIEKSQLDLQPV